ncbi:MAG: hypothetical protein HY698_15975 [Deltaproteobacteria bacterium]|nr:hypothetical protein [Deltaproteobacteria bacterium]
MAVSFLLSLSGAPGLMSKRHAAVRRTALAGKPSNSHVEEARIVRSREAPG